MPEMSIITVIGLIWHLLNSKHFLVGALELIRYLSHYFGVAMADKLLYKIVLKSAQQDYLVPMFLVHVPRTFDFGIFVAKFHGIVRIAFQHEPFRVVKVNHGENLSQNTECQCRFVKWEVLRGQWQ